jgi:hypothetical protein
MRRLAGTLLKAASSLTKRHFFQLLHAIRLCEESTLTEFNFLKFHSKVFSREKKLRSEVFSGEWSHYVDATE